MFGKIAESFRIAFATLQASKTRAGLTMLGIMIGVASVVMLLSIGQAFEKFLVGQFTSFGTNLVAVWGELNTTTQVERGTNMSNADAETRVSFFEPLSWNDYIALTDRFRVPAAKAVSPIASLAANVRFNDNEVNAQVSGVSEAYVETLSLTMEAGRFMTAEEVENSARVVILNKFATQKLFGEEYPIGQTIKIKGLSFEVIGVVDLGANETETESMVIPITTLFQRINSDRNADGSLPLAIIFLQATDSDAALVLGDQIRQVLREEHRLEPEDEDDFQIFEQSAFLDVLSTITGLITAFLAVIASISLVVGGIGIMNIMLVTVTERTREIGLRKAVGARNIDILLQFIVEAITLAVLGGAFGTGLAFLGSVAMSNAVPDLTIVIQPSSVMLATVVSISIGVFFGAFPANRAAKMNPIDALRFE